MNESNGQLSQDDFEIVEKLVCRTLPTSFKLHYMQQNGGSLERDWWDSTDDCEPMRVKVFKPIAGRQNSERLETKYLEGCYASMVEKQVIPLTYLPFAIDEGGNFFCLDLTTGAVCFYAVDAFDPDLSFSVNHANATEYLCEDFGAFVDGLKDEREVDF